MDIQVPYSVGAWLPSDQAVIEDWLRDRLAEVEAAGRPPLHPVVEEFRQLYLNDPEVYMLFEGMLWQARQNGKPVVDSVDTMLHLFSHIMTTAPIFDATALVGFPINAILNWPMATHAGFAAFLNKRVNAQFKKMLNSWAGYLASPASAYVLNEDPQTGWLGRDALKAMKEALRGEEFTDAFVCDPSQEHWGFRSWDDFFTRRFRPGRRPVEGGKDSVVNACESAPYRVHHGVQLRNRFWIKGQPYSLAHMLDNSRHTAQFVGGTVYQAFLSALSYHRWHSPVTGTVRETRVIDGTYYSATPAITDDPASPNESQGYIPQVATRGLIFIEADEPDIGLMCAVFVGMAEVSSCEITVSQGQRVEKGDQLGMFHYGGSTHCLLFRKGVNLQFNFHGETPGLDAKNILLNKEIAKVAR
ncbi:phosphatidylserine decarboxylase family protein [Streptomyces sp. URMC 129]|uniref:phosphatidylserine decarboxylase family protein n=1 Tax=Streptomyces sp. URMC 129 TaxID=3423407 RepID=UPI003F1A101E